MVEENKNINNDASDEEKEFTGFLPIRVNSIRPAEMEEPGSPFMRIIQEVSDDEASR